MTAPSTSDTASNKLTGAELRYRDQARALYATVTTEDLRSLVGREDETADDIVRNDALGIAKFLLGEQDAIIGRLLAVIERLGGPR